jgi:hypothetical protein
LDFPTGDKPHAPTLVAVVVVVVIVVVVVMNSSGEVWIGVVVVEFGSNSSMGKDDSTVGWMVAAVVDLTMCVH